MCFDDAGHARWKNEAVNRDANAVWTPVIEQVSGWDVLAVAAVMYGPFIITRPRKNVEEESARRHVNRRTPQWCCQCCNSSAAAAASPADNDVDDKRRVNDVSNIKRNAVCGRVYEDDHNNICTNTRRKGPSNFSLSYYSVHPAWPTPFLSRCFSSPRSVTRILYIFSCIFPARCNRLDSNMAKLEATVKVG